MMLTRYTYIIIIKFIIYTILIYKRMKFLLRDVTISFIINNI